MKKYLVILVVVLAAALLFAGCGSSGSSGTDVEGVYKLEAGGETVGVLTLKADGEATFSLTEDEAGLPVTYEVKGDTVVLMGADGKAAENLTFTIEDDGLRDFAGNIYEKQ